MPLPHDYVERVYAGVLGKVIGVYLGRPFEGWTYERIMAELGEIRGYVHERRGVPLIVTDDDISGTFTFLRALPDYNNARDLSPAQIGQTWLNYIIENRTILWWGGMGNSTEHTAYLRLKHGVSAPESGSIARNGKVVAEQIGSQIFIDGWAMVAPGDPELAADLARRAASVSHDGEAIYGAQMLAAIEAQAFVEQDINKLLATGLQFIPPDSIIARVIYDIQEWHAQDEDWRRTRERIVEHYGYDRYGGNCHMVPNHALVILGLLYGAGDFAESLMITNTSGWDTDCNSGNLGCLLGIRNGLAAFEGQVDWRGPVADRLYLPTADGGRSVTDAVQETFRIVNIGRVLAGEGVLMPKDGARFHFELPGSLQGFRPEEGRPGYVENVEGHSLSGQRCLALRYTLRAGQAACFATPTFTPPDALDIAGYHLVASPTLYSGQTVSAGVSADETNDGLITCRLYLRCYSANDELERVYGPEKLLEAGEQHAFTWRVPDLGGAPIAEIGLELTPDEVTDGSVYLDFLGWNGSPDILLGRPERGGDLWRRAWVNGVDMWGAHWPEAYRIVQNQGTGLLIQGTREWEDYSVSASITPHLAAAAGIAARVQGMRRYYALLLCDDGFARLVKALDGEHILAEQEFAWEFGQTYAMQIEARGAQLVASVDGEQLFDVVDPAYPLISGAVALVCKEGRIATESVAVRPLV